MGRGFQVILIGLAKPFGWVGLRTFRLFLLPLYSRYRQIRLKIKLHPRLAGVRSVGHFLDRYALYVTLVLIGVFGIGQNLFARTIRPDEVGQGTVWSSLAQDPSLEVIVETAATKPISSGSTTVAVGGPPIRTDAGANTTEGDQTVGSNSIEVLGAIGGSVDTTATASVDVQEYTVQGGDTISTIAGAFGLGSKTVQWANGIDDNGSIKPGQKLKIPARDGLLYTVKSGDTLSGIAQKYGGNEQQILETNGIALAEAIEPGQDILIPGGEPPAPPVQVAAAPRSILERVFVGNTNPPPSIPASSQRFIWPTPNHRINQYYRGRYHTGLDIEGDYSSPIYAAAGGTVEYASADRSGYGLHIIINHGNGFRTLYGHASKIFVKSGQRVSQGQTIAMVGSTGRSTGTHLHFEIRSGGTPLNPLAYY